MRRERASESVTAGHSDKICDQIAASILDEAISQSREADQLPRVAMEVSAKGDLGKRRGTLMLFGEVTLPPGIMLDYESIARKVVGQTGYNDPSFGFWPGMEEVFVRITQQSDNIAAGVNRKRTGAGDQGLMFGGAIAGEGPEFMPLPIMVAHALTNRLTEIYGSNMFGYLRPDGKSQVVIGYENDVPVSVEKVTLAAAHDPSVDLPQVRQDLFKEVVVPVLDAFGFGLKKPDTQYVCNGAGPWHRFGPFADAGTTNRKIIVDSYGGRFPHGGGGLNGKDPTKVDVSGVLGARYVAKALVANGLARRAQVEVCYTIGQPDPDSINIETFSTERHPLSVIESKAKQALNLSVSGIIDGLQLWQPVYRRASVGGWFGRREFPWEQVPSL